MSNHSVSKASFHGNNTPSSNDAETAKLIARRSNVLGPSYRLFYDEPFHPISGEGVWLTDQKGDRYLDVYNNVPSVGHCHPRVIRALAEQSAKLNTHTRYLDDTIINYGENLLATLPQEIDRINFLCTGSEANDLALRIANFETGGTGIVVTELAYHGGTMAVADMSPSLGTGVGDHVRVVAAPSAYRRGESGLAEAFARDVAAAFEDLSNNGHNPSVFIFDTIFSSDGVLSGPVGFLKPAVEAAREAGAIVIADEVQPGFGRTGSHFWGFERHGIVPDIVTMGKPMGAGHPISGLAAKAGLLEGFGQHSRYFNTFGGNAVSCAVAQAVLDVIVDEGLQADAKRVGKHLLDGLDELSKDHEIIGDVRGAGLFIGVDLVKDRATKSYAADETAHIVSELRKRKILISRSGLGGNCLKIRPPLPFSISNADQFLDELNSVLAVV